MIKKIVPILAVMFLFGFVMGQVRTIKTQQAGSKMTTLNAQHFVDTQGGKQTSLGGFTKGPGIEINWRGKNQPQGAEPIDAIAAAADRLKHLQTTDLGGNETAKLLWEAENCLQKMRAIVDASNKAKQQQAAPGSGSGAGFGGTVESKE